MIHSPAAWDLPGLASFVEAVAEATCAGAVAVAADPARPLGFEAALRDCLRGRRWALEEVEVPPNSLPLTVVAKHMGVRAHADALSGPSFEEHAVFLRQGAGSGRVETDRLSRFLDEHRRTISKTPGLAIIVVDAPEEMSGEVLHWSDWLRRGDLVIWAEEHLPSSRTDLAAELALQLAVEVCGWRLDLAADLVRAGLDDLCDIQGWFARHNSLSIGGRRNVGRVEVACPLDQHFNAVDDLRRRIWRAHLAALFPWLEEERLSIVAKHRSRLKIDERTASLGVTDVEEVELGALRWQLSGYVQARERDRLEQLARLRNDLAHRKPAAPHDLRACL
jgi:hypothetical protein